MWEWDVVISLFFSYIFMYIFNVVNKNKINTVDTINTMVNRVDSDAAGSSESDNMDLSNLSTDASFSAPASITVPSNHLTFEDINNIEADLDDYEMISLIFLLYDNVNTAFECLHMIQVMKTTEIGMSRPNCFGAIFDWAQSVKDRNPEWKNMLLEALSVVQCFALLRKLGFKKQEMCERFLPYDCDTSLYLNPVKKVLYRMCENLNIEETKKLISKVNDDLEAKKLMKKEVYDDQYLEIYILYWASIQYITISDKAIDLTNLLKLLKQLAMDIYYENLKNTLKWANRKYNLPDQKCIVREGKCDIKEEPKPFTGRINDSSQNDETMPSMQSSTACSSIDPNSDSSEIYEMDPKNAGILMIINQKNFKNDPNSKEQYDPRYGTNKDKDRLISVFRKFGFRIITHEDLTHNEILTKIKEGMAQFRARDCCFIVAILSHGKEDLVLGTDCYGVRLTAIENCVQDKKFIKLLGKPKILILQACQGLVRQTEILLPESVVNSNTIDEIEETQMNLAHDGPVQSVPEKADFLEICASVKGFAAIRDQKKGSWFIQTFCQLLEEFGERIHLEEIIIKTKSKVGDKRWDKWCMVPESRSTFRKKLYFKSLSTPLVQNGGSTS